MAPETFALFREAMHRLRRAAGGRLDDDAALLSMARQALAGPGDDGRASYQVSLTVCAVCGSASQTSAGELVPVGAEIVAMAECDAQHLGQLLPRAANENASASSKAQLSMRPSESEAPSGVHPRMSASLATASPADFGAHMGAAAGPASDRDSTLGQQIRRNRDAPHGQPRPRAKQSIPPALRRAILARDQHRCRVPGCTHATFVDVHHIVPRSEGGSNDPANLLTICGGHHRAVHRGELSIEPGGESGFLFRHADGTLHGQPVTAHAVDAHAKVFSALRHLGFREREVRAVLAELQSDDHPQPTVAGLLSEALRKIRPAPK